MLFNFSTFQLFNLLALISLLLLPVYAYEDCVITSDGKLSDIKVEKTDIVEVSPIYTLMNEKNTLYVQPLKVGKTKICVLKNDKDIVKFDIEITEDETKIDAVEGFEVLTVDMPFEDNIDGMTPHPPQAVPPLPQGAREEDAQQEYIYPRPQGAREEDTFELDAPPLGGET